jgi:hypothetical protein
MFIDAIEKGHLLRAAACFLGPWPLPMLLLRMVGWRVASRVAAFGRGS